MLVLKQGWIHAIIFTLVVLVVFAPAIALDAKYHIAQNAAGSGFRGLFAVGSRPIIPFVIGTRKIVSDSAIETLTLNRFV